MDGMDYLPKRGGGVAIYILYGSAHLANPRNAPTHAYNTELKCYCNFCVFLLGRHHSCVESTSIF